MTYVVSDLHGRFDKFEALLKEIRFSDNDVMYVLGDTVDIGDGSMELLCDLSMRYNVIPIAGEHDIKALKLLGALDKILSGGGAPDAETLSELKVWIGEGGAKTMADFKELDAEMKEGVLEYLEDFSLYEEVEVKGKKYVLVHAGIADFDPDTPLEDYMPEDFVSEPIHRDRIYFEDATVIAGHVPTYEIEGADRGRIFYGENCILIDCGAAYGESLGCLCLESGKEFYV